MKTKDDKAPGGFEARLLPVLLQAVRERSDSVPQKRSTRRRVRTVALLTAGLLLVGGAAYAIFNDGQVTFEEYERAYTAYVGCIRDAAVADVVEGPFRFGRDPEANLVIYVGVDPTIYLHRNVGDAPPTGDVDWQRVDEVDAACKKQHVGAIERRWIKQEAPPLSKAEQRAWTDRLLECAEEKGIEIPEDLSYEEMLNDVGTDPSDDAIMSIMREAFMKGCRPWEAGG